MDALALGVGLGVVGGFLFVLACLRARMEMAR